MKGVALGALLLCCATPQQVPELDSVLSMLEKRVEGLRDFRASFVYTYFTTDGRTRERRAKSPFSGELAYRAPGRAAWSVHVTDFSYPHQSYAEWVDRARGFRGAVDESEVRLHLPFGLHVPEDFGGLRSREHHGASWYRAPLETHTPAPVPLLGLPPTFHPIYFLYQLAPRAVLGRLPSLKVAGRREEEGRTYIVLSSKPVDAQDSARVDEARRRRDETWFGTEIWVDEVEGAIDRVLVTYENSGAAPRFRREAVFRYSRRVGGLATFIAHEGSQMEFRDLKSNSGVKDEEARIDFPPDAVVRDWVAQPREAYARLLDKDPANPSTWLSLGTLRFREQNYAAAVDAFKKVVEFRPKAPEGYIALSYFLKESSQAPAVLEFLENAVRAGADFPVLRLALAHAHHKNLRGDKALPHFEAVLKQVGEDLKILETMIYMAAWPTPAQTRRHYFRLYAAEIARDEPTFGYFRWENASPTPAELQELAKMYEDAIAANGGSSWMRKRLMDLYWGLKRPKDVRRHAETVVAQVEREENPQTAGSADRAMEFFLAEKDWAGAARLQKAYAAKTGEAAKKIAAQLDVDLLGVRGTMDDLKKLTDERIKAEWDPREKLSFSPTYVRLIKVLQREKRATEFLKKIVESIGDHDHRQLYIDLVETAVRDFNVPHADGQALVVRLKEKTTGSQAGATDLVNLCRQYAWAKQWSAAMEKATQALALKELTAVQRATAEGVLAECHLAAGAFDPAIAALDRALELKEVRPVFRSELQELRARALVGAKKDRPAAEALGRAFSELLAEKAPESRWRALKELRRKMTAVPRAAVEAAAAARPDDAGLRLLLVHVLEREGQFAKAAGALAEAASGDAFLLRELAILWARADEPRKALDARAAFALAREKQRNALMGVQSDDFNAVDFPLVSAMEARDELVLLKEFAVKLAGDPEPGRHTSTLARILVLVFEDAFIEKIHAALMGAATREDQRLNFRYPAAQAWHEMGKTEKAVALYKDAATGKGFAPPYVRAAKELIERWEAEDKDRVELLRWIRSRLDKLPPDRRESEELYAIIHEVNTSRKMALLDRLWRNGLREKKPDPLFVKLAALRGNRGNERIRALEQLAALADVSPEWRLELAVVFLNQGNLPKAVEVVQEALQKSTLPPKDREAFIRKAMSLVWNFPIQNRAELGKDLAAKGLFAWAWELREYFLKDPPARLEFARKWKNAAAVPEDRAHAGRAVAQTLLRLGLEKEAFDELTQALQLKDLPADLLKDLETLRLRPLVRYGEPAEAFPALIRLLEESPSKPSLAWHWAEAVAGQKKGEEWLKRWDAAKPTSAAALFFAAALETSMDRRDAAVARLKEGATRFPENGWFHRQLGDAYSRMGQHGPAADAYEKAIIRWKESDGDALYLRRQLALATGKSGKLKEAAEIIRAVRDRAQRQSFLWTAETLKLYDVAVELYREALEDRKDNVGLRLSLARMLKLAGKPEEAEAEYRQVLSVEGGQRGVALAGLLSSLVDKKDPAGIAGLFLEEARRVKGGLKEVLSISWFLGSLPSEMAPAVEAEWTKAAAGASDVEAVHILSAIMSQYWRWDGVPVIADLEAAVQRFPQSASLHFQLAQGLDRLHQWTDAAAAYEKAAVLDPEGNQTAIPAFGMRANALGALMNAHEGERAIRLAMTLLGEKDPSSPAASFPRQSLGRLEREFQDDFWAELSSQRDRLPTPKDPAAIETIRALVSQLSDDEIHQREAAMRSLRTIGALGLRPLAGLVDSADVELRVRARNTVRAILRN